MTLKDEFSGILPCREPALDHALWLSSPAFRRRAALHRELYREAHALGRDRAARAAEGFLPAALREWAFRRGIRALRPFTETGSDPRRAHSYYLPRTREIEYDDTLDALMAEVQGELELDWFLPGMTGDRLILHEIFHHEEERRDGRVDALLAGQYGTAVPPVYRDIAAFAWVNTLLGGPPCQLLDLLWLYRFRPSICADVLSRCRKFIEP